MSKPPLRLVLSEEQSAAIRESGIKFAIVHPGSYPTAAGRWVVSLVECTQDEAQAACEVAMGQSKARRIKPATTPASPADGSDTRPKRQDGYSAATGPPPPTP